MRLGPGSGVVIVVVIFAATGIGLYAMLALNPQQAPCCGGATPVPFAFGAPTEQVSGTTHWYNFSVQASSGGLRLNDLSFQVQTPSGSVVATTGWHLYAVNLTEAVVGVYTWSSGSWSSGGSTLLSTQETIVLETTTSLSGDHLVVIGGGGFQGTVSTTIP